MQGGDKLTLALGGPNSASATFIPDFKPSSNAEISEFGKKDEDKNSKERCTTPVTVTHFSLNDKNEMIERIVLPKTNSSSEEKSINVKNGDREKKENDGGGDNISDLFISGSFCLSFLLI